MSLKVPKIQNMPKLIKGRFSKQSRPVKLQFTVANVILMVYFLDLSKFPVSCKFTDGCGLGFLDPQFIAHIKKKPLIMCPFSVDDAIPTS